MRAKYLDKSFIVMMSLVLMVSLQNSQYTGGFGVLSHISEFMGFGAHESTSYLFASFTLGLTLGQLIVGPLADRFGRLPIFIIFLNIFSISSLLSALFHTPAWFQFFRLVTGFTVSVGEIVSRSIISDNCNIIEGSRILSIVCSISRVLVSIYPYFVTLAVDNLHIGWQSFFIINAIFCSVVSVTSYSLLAKISDKSDKDALNKKFIQNNFDITIKNKVYINCVLVFILVSISQGLVFYLNPIVILDYFNLSASVLNTFQGPIEALVSAFGFFINAKLIKNNINPVKISIFSTLSTFASLGVMLIFFSIITDKDILFFAYLIGFMLSTFFLVMAGLNTFMIATHTMDDTKVRSGFITSLTVSLQGLCGFCITFLISYIGAYDLRIILVLYTFIALCTLLYMMRRRALMIDIVARDAQ